MSGIVRALIITLTSVAAPCLLTIAAESSSSSRTGGNGADDGRIRVGLVALDIDRTGRLVRPTPDQAAQLRQAFQQLFHAAKTHSHEVVVRPDGLSSLVLDERYAVMLIGQLDAEGELSTECITGAETAGSQITRGAPAGAGDEE